MKLFYSAVVIAIVFIAGVCPPARGADNLLVNGDFESGNTGFTSQYPFFFSNTTEGQYTVTSNTQIFTPAATGFGDHTSGAGLMALFNGSPNANTVAWQETVSVLPNTPYSFSGWTRLFGRSGPSNSLAVDPNPSDLALVVNGGVLSAYQVTSDDTVWSNFSVPWQSNNATSATIQIVDLNTERLGNDFALDDLAFSAVPEPVCAGIICVSAAVGLLSRRRR